jgi:hypothetical protein
MPTYVAIVVSAGDIMLDPKLAARASIPSWNVTHHLYTVDQF